MRYLMILTIITTCLVMNSCKDGDASTNSAPVSTSSPNPTVNSNPTTNPGVEHYICPNGHVGFGGPAAGTCSQCGATLEHNDAFHNTPQPTELANQVTSEPDIAATPTSPTNPGVEHYICPNGHVGSGGPAAGTCSQCGATLEHNDAFHNTPAASAPGSPVTAPTQQVIPQPSGALSPVFQNAGGAPGLGGIAGGGAGQLPEPAQNAAGVWHYVCPDGHPGGAGSATACSQCGKTLVHNAAYHN